MCVRGVRERRPLSGLAGKGDRQAPGSWGRAGGKAGGEWSAAKSLGQQESVLENGELLKLARE